MQGKLASNLVKNEGVMALYSGLSPGLVRSVFYGGLRLGLYEPSLRVSELAFESPNILMKIVAGAFSGAVATAVTNPVEVLKVLSVMDLDLIRKNIYIYIYIEPSLLCLSGKDADGEIDH